jgi:hypothetical protein
MRFVRTVLDVDTGSPADQSKAGNATGTALTVKVRTDVCAGAFTPSPARGGGLGWGSAERQIKLELNLCSIGLPHFLRPLLPSPASG